MCVCVYCISGVGPRSVSWLIIIRVDAKEPIRWSSCIKHCIAATRDYQSS